MNLEVRGVYLQVVKCHFVLSRGRILRGVKIAGILLKTRQFIMQWRFMQ